MMDLAAALIQAIEEQRELLNASAIAEGASGRIEINVNPAMRKIDVQVFVRAKQEAA